MAEGRLTARGKGKRLKVQLGAFDDLMGRATRVLPDDYHRFRLLPNSQADEAERERQDLQRLQGVLDGTSPTGDGKRDGLGLPAKFSEALRKRIAYELISCWVQVRTVEVVLEGIAGEFGGADPLRPQVRDELEETKQRLLTLQERLRFLDMEVVLREPLAEEVEELQRWVRERAGVGAYGA